VSPNGNGGVYSALQQSGALEDMKNRGIKTIFCYGVDNVLIRVADPIFVGCFISGNYDCAVKVVPKSFPEETVGLVCLRDKHPSVVEYSEIDKESIFRRNATTNELLFNAANTCVHLFTLPFLIDVANKELPFHIAEKKNINC